MVRKIIKWFSYFALCIAAILGITYIYLAMFEGKPAIERKIFTKELVRKPLVIAHRGGGGLFPENTLFAFKKSLEMGVDVIELDVRSTSDGKLVVIHDAKVDRTTDGSGAVADMTFEQIRKLDAGFRWTNDGGKTFPFRGKNIVIPTLREVFENFPDAKFNIEPKHETPAPEKPLCDLIREFNKTDKVIVGSFRQSIIANFRRECANVATSVSPSEVSNFLTRYKIGLDKNYSPEMQALQIPQNLGSFQFVTKDFVEAAHKLNLQVHVWTINNKADMKRLIDIGADGIMTDYPDRLLKIVK